MRRNRFVLSTVTAMLETPGWKDFREEALKKVRKHEESVTRLLFRTRSPVDPLEVEYDRGFYQGVLYVLDGLPNTMKKEWEVLLREEEVNS